MTRKWLCRGLAFGLLIALAVLNSGCQESHRISDGEAYAQGLDLEEQGQYEKAIIEYTRALPALLEEQNLAAASGCSDAIIRLTVIKETYPYNEEEVEELIAATYPQMAQDRIADLISSEDLEHLVWDNEIHYFSESAINLSYRYLDLMYEIEAAQKQYGDLVRAIYKSALEEPVDPHVPYQKPETYRGIHTVHLSRDRLPKTGTYRLWLPLPIETGPQTNVRVDKVSPEKWVKNPPSWDGDIGLLYMEIPMEELEEDLLIQVEFSFAHFEQRFTIDPDLVGEYDKESEEYKKYTRSYGNTEVTQEIRDLAQEIAQGETNPYLAARKVYDYIVENIDYSLMPHLTLWPRTGQTESDYVHKNRRGDCGAQSMYFSALCRSLGIPARTTGGYQIFTGNFGGHFWAEFFLPPYGWIPVDTSAAQLAFYPKDMAEEERRGFIDYYFGGQDAMRCVIQKDIDVPFVPPPQRTVLLPMTLQFPAVEYSVPTGEIGEYLLLENWSLDCEKMDP